MATKSPALSFLSQHTNTHNLAGKMASNNNTTTNSTAGLAIDWANLPPIPVDCEKCGAAFDAVDEAHSHRCSICQDLFGSDEPADATTSARHATTAPKRRKRAAESANEQVSQQNEPTAKRSKTSQQQATTMQNAQTAQPFGVPPADPEELSESDRLIEEFLELNPTIPTELEDITQPWDHAAENSETLPTSDEQTTQPGEDDNELRNILRTAIKEMDEQSTK